MILRPYSTQPDADFPIEDLEIYTLLGEKGKKITGYECVSVYHGFRSHPKEVTYGVMDDYGYDHFGWFGFTIELWDAATEAGIEKDSYRSWNRWHPPEDELKLLKWNDENLQGKGFIPWQTFDHPQLGKVEIGGWDYKNVWQNAPVQYLPSLCKKQCDFAISLALMCPRLAISRTDVTYVGGDIYHLVLEVENQGFLPTYTSQKALERKAIRPIEVILSLPDGVSLISGNLEQEIDHLEGRSNKALSWLAKGTDYRLRCEWVVKSPKHTTISVTACSERAGFVKGDFSLKSP